MKNNKELFEELQNNIAISNFEKKEYTLKKKSDWRVYSMKKKIMAISTACFILVSGVAFAFNGEKIINYFRGLDSGIDTAVKNGYIEDVDMESQEKKVSVENNKVVDNMYMGAKIDDFVMDDYNLSVKFTFNFDENIDSIVDLSNLHNIELSDLYILDENNVVIYSMLYDEKDFNKMCEKHNLELKWGEHNEKYLGNGLNSFIASSSKELRQTDLQYNMYTDKYPKSKQLDFYFSKIAFKENDKEEKTVLTGDWHIHLDVPEKFYNRTEEYYKVVSSTNDRFNVYTAKVTDTGFEFGMTISDEKKVEYPEEARKETRRIIEEYGVEDENGVVTQESNNIINQKLNEMRRTSPYKEMIEKYETDSQVILSHITPVTKLDDSAYKEGCYIINSNGEKFECSWSPSRKSNQTFIDGDKFDYYETYTMTKYDTTDELTMVVNYRGTREVIKLQKIQ